MLEEMKIALRITHNRLDGEIQTLIDTAFAEMIRAGVRADVLIEDPLIKNAIKTFVKMEYTSDINKREKFEESFKYQMDNIRKSGDYCAQPSN